MPKPKIKHIAIMCMNPGKLADFYVEVFDMEVQHRAKNGSVFLSDGYMNLALLSQKAEGKPNGLNHIGFQIDSQDVIAKKLAKHDGVGPEKRPADRHFAETRATDPEGNNFDLSVNGYERIRPDQKL